MADSVTVPADDTSASWLDRLLETVAGPKATEDPNYGPDSTFAQIYDKYARPMNPLNLLVGAAQEVPALAAKVPLNAARFASRFSPDPNAEQYLSGDDPESIGAKIDALTKTGALSPRDFGQSVGAAGTDIMAMVAGDEALALPALSEALPSAVKGLPGLAKTVDWAGTNIGKGGLYGQLLDNDAETGAVAGGIGGAAIGSGEAVLSRAAPFLESAAEKSLGRVIAPGKEAWKKFVGKNAQDIIRDVPLSAAAPWREGGGLQGIVDYAQQQADNIGVSLDAAYAARLQPDIAPKLKGIRDQIRATADNLLQAHGMAVVNLAPESKQALEEIRASLATGRGKLNPTNTNISALQDAASRLQDVVSGLGPEMQRVGAASPRAFQGQLIQRGIARGAQSTAEQGIARAMGDIGDVINTDLVGTRMATEPLARRIDKLRMNFGDMNAAGEFVSTDPAFTSSIEKLAATVRSYGPEMNAQQLRNLAQDWGKIVSGANGRGFLSPMADESMKGAMRAARGEVETTRDALMGDTVRDQSNEFAFWKRLSEAAESTAERRVGHTGGGLFGAMATLAGVGGGEYAAHAAGHGLVGSLGLGAGGAAAAAVTVRVMRSPLWNLLSAKTKLSMAQALRTGTNAALGTAMRRALLELSLLNHGGLSALGHQDLTATEADAEHHNIINGRGPTPGVLESANPDTVYGSGGSVDPGIEHNQRLLQQQDQIDQSIEEAAPPLDPQTESRVYDKLANTQVASAGLSRLPEWLQTQLVNAPDLGATHPHLQKLANLIAEQTSPLNLAFLGDEALRPLAAGTKLAGASEMVGKGLAAAMAAAGLQTGLEGVQEGRPGKVIGGGVQTALGALGLRGGGVAGAAEEAAAALTPAARRAGGFATRVGQGLAGAGKAAVIGPAIGLASTALADTDLAKSLIPDDETRNAVFNAAGMGAGVVGLGMAAGKGMKGLREEAAAGRLKAVTEHLDTLDPATKASVVDEVAQAFPVLDGYHKPTAHLTDRMLAKRAADLSPEAQQVVGTLRAGLAKGDKIAPAEMQALITGREYVPDRTVRDLHRSKDPDAKTLPGAPFDVTSRSHENTRLKEYMQLVKEGKDGWDWYEKGGRAVMFHANDDPAFARQISEALAFTSPATEVLVNGGFGFKGVNQARAGVPIETGRFPARMSREIGDVFSEVGSGASGLKVRPFRDALARGGDFKAGDTPERPVNDIWQGEAWGYINPDGTPLRRGFTAEEHKWMDRMSDKALAAAKSDPALAALIPKDAGEWTLSRLQAAAWVGAKRRVALAELAARAEKTGRPTTAAQIAKAHIVPNFADAIERNYGHMSRETVPAKQRGGGHMKELHDPNYADAAQLKQDLHDLTLSDSGQYDAQGRDQILASYGGMPGKVVEGVGMFKGDTAPGLQQPVVTGSVLDAAGSRALDEGSLRIMRATDASQALLNRQAATAGGKAMEAGSGVPRTTAVITLGRPPTRAETLDTHQRILAHGGTADTVAQSYTGKEMVLLNLGMDPKAFAKLAKDVNKAHGQPGGLEMKVWSGYYDTNKWNLHGSEFGQGYHPQIEPLAEGIKPGLGFDVAMPGLAERKLRIDAELKRRSGGRLSLDKNHEYLLKTMANEGWAGMKKLSREFGVPVTLLAAALRLMGATPPSDDTTDGA
jgi:hypothetical protein